MAFSSWDKVVPAPGPDEGILLLVMANKKTRCLRDTGLLPAGVVGQASRSQFKGADFV